MDVDHRHELVDECTDGARRVLDSELRARLERPVAHPADACFELARDDRRALRIGEHVPARDVDVVSEPDRDRLRRHRCLERSVRGLDALDPGTEPGGQHDHVVAGTPHAARYRPGVAAVVVVVARHGADHPLHGEPARVEVAVERDLDRLQVLEQRRAAVPRHVRGAVDDVVALERRDGDHVQVGDAVSIDVALTLDLGPAIAVREQPKIDVVEREWQGHAQPENPRRNFYRLAGTRGCGERKGQRAESRVHVKARRACKARDLCNAASSSNGEQMSRRSHECARGIVVSSVEDC